MQYLQKMIPQLETRIRKTLSGSCTIYIHFDKNSAHQLSEAERQLAWQYLERLNTIVDILCVNEQNRQNLCSQLAGFEIQHTDNPTNTTLYMRNGILHTIANFSDIASIPSEADICRAIELNINVSSFR